MEHQDQKGERCGNRQDVEKRPRPRFQHSDDRRHSHVLGTLKGQHGAQHGEPEEEDAGKFVRPDQRLLEQIAGGNARKEHDDFRDARALPRQSRRATPGALLDSFARPPVPRALASGSAALVSSAICMAVNRCCRRISATTPRPRRRTWPWRPCRTTSWRARPGRLRLG